MSSLLKWFSVLLFISSPLLIAASIWMRDGRFAWIAIVTAFFSLLAGGMADAMRIRELSDAAAKQDRLF